MGTINQLSLREPLKALLLLRKCGFQAFLQWILKKDLENPAVVSFQTGLSSVHTAVGTVSGLHATPVPGRLGEGWKGGGSLRSVGAFSASEPSHVARQPPRVLFVIRTGTPRRPAVPGRHRWGRFPGSSLAAATGCCSSLPSFCALELMHRPLCHHLQLPPHPRASCRSARS